MQSNITKKQEISKRQIEAGKKNLEKGKWKKWQSWNAKWREKKSFQGLALELQQEGFVMATKEAIAEAYQILLAANEEKLIKLVNDSAQPMTIRVVAKRILNTKDGHDMIEKMLDRVHGKPNQSVTWPWAGWNVYNIIHNLEVHNKPAIEWGKSTK